jgi:RNA polymerase sigma factor (sigma-70 family)
VAGSQTYLETLFRAGSFAGLPDGDLLERFIAGPPYIAEVAFTALVERHGAMVRRTCRHVTGDYHDAEDAAQATFLILARSARSIRSSDSLSSWLYGVACRVSARANADAARRRAREQRAAELAADASPRHEPWLEVHEELARLPERYRLPIVLCYLEGLSYVQVAHQLRCPVRTLQTRLARGRERLRSRLARRGLGPATGSLIATLAPESASAAWVQGTVRLAMLWSTKGGPATAGSVPASAALAGEVLRAMIIHKLKIALSCTLLAAASVAGAWAWTGFPAIPTGVPTADEVKALGRGVAIKGWVAGPDGKPLAGAKLRSPLLKIREEVVTTGPDGSFTITADANPQFRFKIQIDAPGLASKAFYIEIGPRTGLSPTRRVDGSVPAPTAYFTKATREISPSLDMDRGSVVTGRIVREGKPLPGATIGLWGFDVLESPEVKADAEGRFRFPHVPANSPCWAYVPTGSLERAGAVPARSLRTAAEDSAIDVGDLTVQPGRMVSGRVVFADGKPLPANAEVIASADHAGGELRAKPDRSGHFTLAGLPAGLVSMAVLFPDDQFYAPAGYRLSARNKCRDPLNPYLLMGRVDRDVADLTILFEPGEQPPPSHAPDRLAAFKEAQAGPITGVPPGRDE